MKKITRRDFLKNTLYTSSSLLLPQMLAGESLIGQDDEKLVLNVGYLPISDHLILPVSHALFKNKYQSIRVRPFLCKSWDEILGKVYMGILHAAFMLAPLAMYEMNNGSPLRCVLLGHTNGSVLATSKYISESDDLLTKKVGIPHARSTHRAILYKYFRQEGLENINQIQLVKIPPPETLIKMKEGEIDAYIVAEPWGAKGMTEGVSHILEYSKNIIPNHVCCLVMINKSVINKKPAQISEWVNSLQFAGEYIHDHPDKAAILQQSYMGHAPDLISRTVKENIISYKELKPDRKKLTEIHDLALECGIFHNKCDLVEFTDYRFS